MSDDAKVMAYFDAHAPSFDAIYSGAKPGVLRVLDRLLRQDMWRRFEVALAECGDVRGRRVLDVGCGSGRYAVELARRGAARVLGLDYAPGMIAIARRLAAEAGVDGVCEWRCADLAALGPHEVFDVSLAIGVFDYVRDPVPLLARMASVTRGQVITTFPVRWRVRTPIRKVRLGVQGCPVFFFTRRDLDRIFDAAGYRAHRVVYEGQIYVVVAEPAPGARLAA